VFDPAYNLVQSSITYGTEIETDKIENNENHQTVNMNLSMSIGRKISFTHNFSKIVEK
jgi:hypothetical protein